MRTKPIVLVIDDDPLTHRIMERILASICTVRGTKSGKDGVAMAIAQQPDLILLDMVMPDFSGQEVIKALKSHKDTQDIPTIFVTAETNFQVEANALEMGAVDFITKPVNPLVLIARVKTHLRLRRRELELTALYAELDRKNQQLKELSTHDPLTGLYNRVMLFDFIEKQFAYLIRYQSPCSLVMLDLDHFKAINDEYGHSMGDTVLTAIARRLCNRLRNSDLAFRYGGEEFLVILPQAGISQAKELFEQIRQDIHDDAMGGLPQGKVTVSVGITELSSDGDSVEEATNRADHALYESKHRGRNRVTVF
ncbi:diguanylate cyclase [Methylomonas koyamae]|uniref:GGDEF domain-containing response regulator n=1 Tax=Methylomonas koyamae TaxID=702114 RepID=UPI00112A5B69|nr:diguanylate cyclase [Methylomonas koyamae]TPQ28854.1 diguanylate cyclase response regulator [Methylomonas koyamae]